MLLTLYIHRTSEATHILFENRDTLVRPPPQQKNTSGKNWAFGHQALGASNRPLERFAWPLSIFRLSKSDSCKTCSRYCAFLPVHVCWTTSFSCHCQEMKDLCNMLRRQLVETDCANISNFPVRADQVSKFQSLTALLFGLCI